MSSEVTLPDVWWLCDDPDWLQSANSLCHAGDLVIELKCMSLDVRMDQVLAGMRDAERSKTDTTPFSHQYTELMKRKQRLRTKEGRMEFHDEMLTAAYEKRRVDSEALPL